MTSETVTVTTGNTCVAPAAAAKALDEWIRTGVVDLGYVMSTLGDWRESGDSSSLLAPLQVTIRKAWRGRAVRTSADRARMDCPFAPERDA